MSADKRKARTSAERRNTPLRACVQGSLQRYLTDLNGQRPTDMYKMVMQEVEMPLLETVMRYTQGNQCVAANILGINRNTLRKKLKQYGLH